MTAEDDRAREEITAALIRWWADEAGEPVDQLDAAQESARQYADALLPTVRALMDQAAARAYEQGRASVGLADFVVTACDEEAPAPAWYFVEQYGEWLPCNRREGHDGDHEHSDSGYTWPRDRARALTAEHADTSPHPTDRRNER